MYFPPTFAGDGGDRDDTPCPLLDHRRNKRLRHGVDAGEVDRQHAMPQLIGMVEELGAARVARVVHQNVHAAPGVEHAPRQPLRDALRIGDIARDGERTPPHPLDLRRQLVQFGLGARSHRHIGARRSQRQRDAPPDALRRARHHGAPADQRQCAICHARYPFTLSSGVISARSARPPARIVFASLIVVR